MNIISSNNSGLIILNYSLVEKVKNFIKFKENQLANSLLDLLFPKNFSDPSIANTSISLNALIRFLKEEDLKVKANKSLIFRMNQSLWQFLEILETSVKELFYEIGTLEFNKWNDELYSVITELKELFLYYLEELPILIKEIEKTLLPYNKFVSFYKRYLSTFLDNSLLKNLSGTKLYLNKNFNLFLKKFNAFSEESSRIARKAKKYKGFNAFNFLDKDAKKEFLNFYKIVKLWEYNKKNEFFSKEDFRKVIKEKIPLKTKWLLKEYFQKIQKLFFYFCEEWKLEGTVEQLEKVEFLESELKSFVTVVNQYRQLLLNTDPNPYVRSRLGFAEWIVGPEPERTQELLDIIYVAEALIRIIEKFFHNTKREKEEEIPAAKQYRIEKAIETVLHEMGQPLSSKNMMRGRVDKILQYVEDLDELGGSAGEVGPLITAILLKVFRLDWHYQTLFENAKFNEIWNIHINLEKLDRDAIHERRLEHLRKMIISIERWVTNHDSFKHLQNIETDVTDAKEQFQEYFSTVKRHILTLSGIEKVLYENQINIQILEYYELFSRFFFFLRKHEANGKIILNQFQFVDHYLAATLNLFNANF